MHNVLLAHINEHCSLSIQFKHNTDRKLFHVSILFVCSLLLPLISTFIALFYLLSDCTAVGVEFSLYQAQSQSNFITRENRAEKIFNQLSAKSTKMILHSSRAYIKISFLFCVFFFTYFRYTFGQSSQNINVCK